MAIQIRLLLYLAAALFAVVATAACSARGQPFEPPPPTAIPLEPTAIPQQALTEAPGEATRLAYRIGEDRYYLYLTEFQRTAHPDREGWDVVNATITVYIDSSDPSRGFPLLNRVPTCCPHGRAFTMDAGYPNPDPVFGIHLVWSGGSAGTLAYGGDLVDYFHFRVPAALDFLFKADVPTAMQDVEFAPFPGWKGAALIINDSGPPLVWTPDAMVAEFKWLFGRSSNNLFIESADDLTVFIEPIDDLTNVAFVAYHDMSTHVDGNELVWGIDVENQSMAEDLGLKKACIRNIMFLDAAGRVIDEGEEDDPCFDWEDRSILPPAFRVSGTVKVRLPQDAGEVKYVAGQFDLPGIGAHWRLLPVPTAAGARP